LEVTAGEGWYYLRPMQSYSGVRGKTSDGIILSPMKTNQQALQMDDDALAIINDQPMMVPGAEGLKDIHIVEKINQAAENNSRVLI
ncbi:MAG: gfo/Idh/MocA family oxidoreductase, partial [Gramella sp.]|nr:gfo/Idh/MocA family oxidoreductase [Christiangramia sp.]